MRTNIRLVAFIAMLPFPLPSNAASSKAVDEYGSACVSMIKNGTERGYHGTLKYNYSFQNICNRGFTIAVRTIAGWEGLTSIGPNGTANWFCTDGAKSNRDCNGGAYTFEVR